MSVYKECDIRGVVPQDIDSAFAWRLGLAYGQEPSDDPIYVGRDTRPSSQELSESLMMGLMAAGRNVVDLRVVPTPAFTYKVVTTRASGVMVTASHNPAKYNGFKMVRKGFPLHGEAIRSLSRQVESDLAEPGGGARSYEDIVAAYVRQISALAASLGVDSDRNARIVIDAGNGAASLTAESVLRDLGFRATTLFADLDGSFPNRDPNPVKPGALDRLGDEVKASKACLGVGFDGDGDRACFVDETGRPLSPEKTILLLLNTMIQPGDTVVYDAKCSMAIERAILARGGKPAMERSGYAFIRRRMFEEKASFGAELSGHYFFGSLYGADDALLSACLIADIAAQTDASLSKRVDALPELHITPDIRIEIATEERRHILETLQHHEAFADRVSTMDGVRIILDNGWALVRPSVTEPVLTLRFEGVDRGALEEVKDTVLAVVPEIAARVRTFLS